MTSLTLYSSQLNTPLGPMTALSDHRALYLLEFLDHRCLKKEIKKLQHKTNAIIVESSADPIDSIHRELEQYFKGYLREFKTPLCLVGSDFQKNVWAELRKIPFGKTCSYANLSAAIKKPSAFRAVAQANSMNRLPILIPCHRVINSNGELGGYSAGIFRKKWLLEHEHGR